ncbi:MAG: hypothetical protein MZV70_39315 [Desulfobacterales bacterium]|nr:hypothetical protein [Desulfobacterales bacterium]
MPAKRSMDVGVQVGGGVVPPTATEPPIMQGSPTVIVTGTCLVVPAAVIVMYAGICARSSVTVQRHLEKSRLPDKASSIPWTMSRLKSRALLHESPTGDLYLLRPIPVDSLADRGWIDNKRAVRRRRRSRRLVPILGDEHIPLGAVSPAGERTVYDRVHAQIV